jgi:hypothetical protein
MGIFTTEKKTEEWLVEEVRDILMPDGSYKPVRAFKLLWAARDFLEEHTDVTEEKIAEIAQMYVEETGKPYEEAYFDTVGHMDTNIRKQYGLID